MRMHFCTAGIAVSLSLLLVTSSSGQPPKPVDTATFMPADTALYVGWSGWVDPAAPEFAANQRLFQALLERGLEDEGDAPPGVARLVLQMLGAVQTGSVAIGVFNVVLSGDTPDIQAAAVIEAGERTRQAADALEDLAAQSEAEVETVTVSGATFHAVPLGDGGPLLMWALYNDKLIVSLGPVAALKVIGALDGKTPNLATIEELQFERRKLDVRPGEPHIAAYVDVQRIIARAREIVLEQEGELPPIMDPLLRELGLTAVRSKYLHVWRTEGVPRIGGFAHIEGELRGIAKLFDQKPVTDDDLKIVPKDAYWMEVGNFDLLAAWREVLRVLNEVAPDLAPAVEAVVAAARPVIGFSITEDLLPALGDTWAIFDAPAHGGFLFTGTVMVLEARNPQAAHEMLVRALEVLAAVIAQNFDPDAEMSPRVHVRELEHEGRTIHYAMIAGVPSPVAPAWTIVENRLVFGLWPQTVAIAAKQVDAKTRGPSILENKAFVELRSALPPQAMSVGYLDTRAFVRALYPFGLAFGTMGTSMIGGEDVGIDFRLLPPLQQQLADTTNYVETLSRDPDGFLYQGKGDFGGLWLGVAAAALAVSILLPSVGRARHQAKRVVSMSNLRGIAMAVVIYAADHDGQFPKSLDQLVEGDYIKSEQLVSPTQPDEPAYVLIPRDKPINEESQPSESVLAYERPVSAEGTNVAFVDGHVEFMKMDEFRRAVRETYERLGRPVPEEFEED